MSFGKSELDAVTLETAARFGNKRGGMVELVRVALVHHDQSRQTTTMRYLLAFALTLPLPALAQDDPAHSVEQERLRQDVEPLVSFGTRHTLSDPDDQTRGIGAARRWATSQFEDISAGCGGCLEIVHPQYMVSGDRIPEPVLIQIVVAILRGTERPDEVTIVQAHIDSRASDVMDAASDAPGANDNASGSALVLEAARVLQREIIPPPSYSLYYPAKSRVCSAENCWLIMLANKAGQLRPCSTMMWLAGLAALTDIAMRSMCASFPKACVPMPTSRPATGCAAVAGPMTAPAETSHAGWMDWPTNLKAASTFGKRGAVTEWGGAGITCPFWIAAFRPSAFPWQLRIMIISIRIYALTMA